MCVFHPAVETSCFGFGFAVEELLTGKVKQTRSLCPTIDPGQDGAITDLRESSFLKLTEKDAAITGVNRSVSAVMLLPVVFSQYSPSVALHPNPIHRFDPSCLPEAHFCAAKLNDQGDSLAVEWLESQSRNECEAHGD
jgi:hypothetical protein